MYHSFGKGRCTDNLTLWMDSQHVLLLKASSELLVLLGLTFSRFWRFLAIFDAFYSLNLLIFPFIYNRNQKKSQKRRKERTFCQVKSCHYNSSCHSKEDQNVAWRSSHGVSFQVLEISCWGFENRVSYAILDDSEISKLLWN